MAACVVVFDGLNAGVFSAFRRPNTTEFVAENVVRASKKPFAARMLRALSLYSPLGYAIIFPARFRPLAAK